MFEDVIVGALGNLVSEVVSATARQLEATRFASNKRRHRRDLVLAGYFSTYEFAQIEAPGLVRHLAATIGASDIDAVTQRLASDRSHAVLHELLAARLTHAPEQHLEKLRSSFSGALWPLGTLDRVAADKVADGAFTYLDDEIRAIVRRLEEALPNAAQQLRDRAIGQRIIAILDAIERHEAAIADDGDPSADAELLKRYLRHVVEEFGTVMPPDLEQRRRIPIADLYVPPYIVPIPEEPTELKYPSVPLLAWLTENIDRTVLLGDPGAGKTTAARALAHAHARTGVVAPFLVTLRDFAADGTVSVSVVQHIEHVMNTVYQCPPPRSWVRRQLLDGAALVIFEGLDELVDTARRAEISSIIEHFCIEYPLARVLVTSRFVGYDQARLDERTFDRFHIDRFYDGQVAEYARKWFASDRTLTAAQAARDAAAFVAESAAVPDLRSNPLILSLMCVLYRGEGYIPQHRTHVYRSCADLLFHRWDSSRHIRVNLVLTRTQVQRLLRGLAHWLFTREDVSTAVTERQLVAKTSELLLMRDVERPEQAEAAAVEFVTFCRGRGWVLVDVGTTATGEPLYSFAHRTFLEYFAAGHVAADADTPEALARMLMLRLARGEWDVIAQLAIAMKDEAIIGGGQRVLQALLNDRRYTSNEARGNLILIATSCVDSVDLTPDYARVIIRLALDFLLNPETGQDSRTAVLTWSRLSVRQRRELVAAEFQKRAAKLIDSDNAHVRAAGLYLGTADFPQTEHTGSGFWADWIRTNALAWHDTIVRDAASELATLHLALDFELLTVREVLAQPGGAIRMTSTYAHPVAGFLYGSWLGWRGYDMRMTPMRDDLSLRACQQFGAHLLEDSPHPPFTRLTSWSTAVPDGYVGGELSIGDSIAEPVYLAVAVLIAIEVESRAKAAAPTVIAACIPLHPHGWLSALAPYIRMRLGEGTNESTSLAPLPVREDYQQLFDAWAHQEVNFTGE